METLLPLLPLLEKFDGKIIIETMEMILPPNYDNVFQIETEPGKMNVVLGFVLSDFYEYDIDNNKPTYPISTTSAGIYRESAHFKWGFIPLVGSIQGRFIPDFSISRKGSENIYRAVNNSLRYIYLVMVVFMLEFSRDYESEIREWIRNWGGANDRSG